MTPEAARVIAVLEYMLSQKKKKKTSPFFEKQLLVSLLL